MKYDNYFVLEAFDTETECVALDLSFHVSDVGELLNLLKMGQSEFRKHSSQWLDVNSVRLIKSTFGMKFESGDMPVALRSWNKMDGLPYKTHSNRELLLMLSGLKPLAFFSGPAVNSCQEDIPERLFDPYVKLGRFMKAENVDFSDPMDLSIRHRNVLYVLRGEEWRIEAFFSLLAQARAKGWTEELTRRQGSLLGYEDWQNDAFIEMIYRPGVAINKASGTRSFV